MKARLLFAERDFPLTIGYTYRNGYTLSAPALPPNADDLIQDLELETLLTAMAGSDGLIFALAKLMLLSSISNPDEIVYRQEILADCLAHPELAREIYTTAAEAIAGQSRVYQPLGNSPSGVLRRAVEVLEFFVGSLRRLRVLADENVSSVNSRGMRTLFMTLREQLDDEYFAVIAEHLQRLKFRSGMLLSADLGPGCRGAGYILRTPQETKRSFFERFGAPPRHALYFEVHPRDEAGARMLGELNDRGINLVANAVAQSTDHILSFFELLCGEIGFYVGCLNLADDLRSKKAPFAFPEPAPLGQRRFTSKGLYDVSLAISLGRGIVGNDLAAKGKSLFVVTGANQGGKSTFLRSVGLAQLMMQCGMFVGASAFAADVVDGIFTHYKREEDSSMTSGKLDEELARMSQIVDWIHANSLLLSNESFAATNEREGSEIAREIVNVLLAHKVKVVLVTHLYDLAHGFRDHRSDEMFFLRAEREDTGERTFRLIEADPLETSYGEDLYHQIFEQPTQALAAE